MNEPTKPIIKRQRKRRTNLEESDSSIETETLSGDSAEERLSSDVSQKVVEQKISHQQQLAIDLIRSEIQDDTHHGSFDEPFYTDDSHDWSEESESISSDYWHFLGSYE